MHITSLAYFPVLVKVLHNELPWKCPKLDGLSTLFCIIVGNMTLYHTINTLCITTDYLVTIWQRLLVHNSGYFHKIHLFKVTNDPPVLFLHYRKRYSRPLESESATRTQIVEVPWKQVSLFFHCDFVEIDPLQTSVKQWCYQDQRYILRRMTT